MTLQNLLGINRLQTHRADRVSVLKLLNAARRNLADAKVPDISTDNRFDAAYKCIMQCAMLALWGHGYRTSTSQPGHHQTAIQCLVHTLSMESDDIIVLDTLRRARNLSDYEGDPISEVMMDSCIKEAATLLPRTERWLAANRPDLVAGV